jgi:TRAP-type C4-dicarboxylate transport system permease small subunit
VIKYVLDHFEEALGALVMFIMVTLTFVNVVTRYLIVYPLAFTEEITISLFVWLTLLGVSIAFRANAHLAVTVVYDMASPAVRKAFYYVATGMSLLFFVLLAWLGTVQVMDEVELGVTTESLAIPSWIYTGAVPLFSVLIIVRILQAARATLRENRFRE